MPVGVGGVTAVPGDAGVGGPAGEGVEEGGEVAVVDGGVDEAGEFEVLHERDRGAGPSVTSLRPRRVT